MNCWLNFLHIAQTDLLVTTVLIWFNVKLQLFIMFWSNNETAKIVEKSACWLWFNKTAKLTNFKKKNNEVWQNLRLHCIKIWIADFNLTFYNERKTWSEAKDFCFVNGGILETDETIIIKDHDYTKDNVKLWLGAYSLITPWSGVFGKSLCKKLLYQTDRMTNLHAA